MDLDFLAYICHPFSAKMEDSDRTMATNKCIFLFWMDPIQDAGCIHSFPAIKHVIP